VTRRGRHRRPSWTGFIVAASVYVSALASFSAYATVVMVS
jgi:hypothetical protein